MIKNLGTKVAALFGEGSEGLNPDYVPLEDAPPLCGRLFQYLPYDTYDPESGLFFNQSSTGFCLIGTPVAGASFNDQGKMDQFFTQESNLPEGSSMQFLLVASPRIEDKLDYWLKYRNHPATRGLAEKRHSYFKKMAFDTKYPVRDFRVIISYSLPDINDSPVEKDNLMEVRDLLQSTFTNIGLHTRVMDDKDLIREVGNIINHEENTKEDGSWYSSHEEIARLIPDSDVDATLTKDGFFLRNKEFVAHSFLPKKTPKLWALAHMDKLFGDTLKNNGTIPCPFIMHYGFTICEGQAAQKKSAELKREMAESACKSGLSKWQPGVEEEFLEAKEIVQQIQKGSRVIDACFSVTTFCKPRELKAVKKEIGDIWSDQQWVPMSATYNHLNIFLGSLPMMWSVGRKKKATTFGLTSKVVGAASSFSGVGITRRTITKESQNLLPVVAEWTGQVAPGIPIVGRRGQLGFWSPFDGRFIPGEAMYKTPGNYNFCITGESGSGKSFLCNEIINNTLDVGGKAFVMDKGESFKDLCRLKGGEHLHFDYSEDFSVNPFTHIPEGNSKDEKEGRAALFVGLQSIVRKMAFPDGQTDEGGFLNEAINLVWKQKASRGSIDDIAEILKRSSDRRSTDIARCLFDFTSGGIYGSYFNPPANLDISADFVVFETAKLEQPLKGVMVLMMMVQVWQRMISSDRNAPFLVLIDEASKLLVGDDTATFISELARNARKYRCSLGLATQSLMDFFKEGAEGPRDVWENSSWKVILRQNDDTINGLQHHAQLGSFVDTPYKKQMLLSLSKAKDFSEFVLVNDAVPGIPCRLFCDPYTTILYSTDGDEVSQLRDLQASGKTLGESIGQMLEERKGRKKS